MSVHWCTPPEVLPPILRTLRIDEFTLDIASNRFAKVPARRSYMLERELGIKVGFAIADRCDSRSFFIDRGVSEGMLRAAERAGARDQPIDIVALDYDAADKNLKGKEDATKIQRAYARGMLYMEKND